MAQPDQISDQVHEGLSGQLEEAAQSLQRGIELAAAVSERFAQRRDHRAADRRLRGTLVIFARVGRLDHVTGHVVYDRGDAHVGNDIDNGESIAFCLSRYFSRCRVVNTCGQQQVPP